MGCGASQPSTVTPTGTESGGGQYLSLAHLKGGLPDEYSVTPPKFPKPQAGQFATLDALGANEAIDPETMDTYDTLAAGLPADLAQHQVGGEDVAGDSPPNGGDMGAKRMGRRPSVALAEIADPEVLGAAAHDEQDLEGFNGLQRGPAISNVVRLAKGMASAVAAGASVGDDGASPLKKRSGGALWKLAAAHSKDGRFLTLKDMEDGLPGHLTQHQVSGEDVAGDSPPNGGDMGTKRMGRRPSVALAEIADPEAPGAAAHDEQDLEGFGKTRSSRRLSLMK